MSEQAAVVQLVGQILKLALQAKASDVHLRADHVPMMRVGSGLAPITKDPMAKEVIRMISDWMTPAKIRDKAVDLDQVDFSAEWQGTSRFRVHRFRSRGEPALVLRLIPLKIPEFAELRLPAAVKQMAELDRGLLLVTGATGMGKSTTIASLIHHICSQHTRHVLTIEDPIEFVIPPSRSIVSQREVGQDVADFSTGLWSALREDPDVIFIGEVRDVETVRVALQAAETGHLVISAIHTIDVTSTVEHLINMFPSSEQGAARLRLAEVLQGVLSQRLIPAKGTHRRVLATEVMLRAGGIQECIRKPERTRSLVERIAHSVPDGMQTFDQDLRRLFEAGVIELEVARAASSSPADFARNLQVM